MVGRLLLVLSLLSIIPKEPPTCLIPIPFHCDPHPKALEHSIKLDP